MASPIEVTVPDIGGFKDVNVIDVLVKDGQQIEKETPLVTIETEKAAMDVPSPVAGKIAQVKLKTGDKVSEGSLILLIEAAAAADAPADKPAAAPESNGNKAASPSAAAPPEKAPAASTASGAAPGPTPPAARPAAAPPAAAPRTAAPAAPNPPAAPRQERAAVDEQAFSRAHASPSVRKFARELGADLGKVMGTGIKGRITQDDVKAHVKSLLTAASARAPAAALPRVPVVDFAQFGAIEIKPLSRIQKISGTRLQASWLNLPHVTQHEDADITELEAARAALKEKASQEGVRLTPLVFIIKACIRALEEFPRFNASLDESGENLVFKKYFNIGFAADTPNGLVVPVIANADQLDTYAIARALATMSEKARTGKLKAAEMHGGSFTISSLGGIGGTYFTPIINAPEVAVLGVSRSSLKPVYERGAFVPRLMLPLSLSYDHRVIDGAEAARFVVFLAKTLGEPKALL
ncbi:MAG TPA: 2-oxo acid dehydrogenase subunit E2 [Steroidobacteraceae bacterium]|jgi:pyruvate dehydrogenase E2 component (dihydrolipoamide acetyltransferase)|nr:2-oxo acid dehydrogenase subunit E2 [Steroidobacteraceae bacterium]